MLKNPKVMSGGDACNYLDISRSRFEFLAKKYKIPFQQTSACKIYFQKDLDDFQNSRKSRMKHARK